MDIFTIVWIAADKTKQKQNKAPSISFRDPGSPGLGMESFDVVHKAAKFVSVQSSMWACFLEW